MTATTGLQLRSKRAAAGISGVVLSGKSGFSRAQLTNIERGYVHIDPAEMARIDALLDQLINAKDQAISVAASLGWPEPGTGVLNSAPEVR